MDDPIQAAAYAAADFADPHGLFIRTFQGVFAGRNITGPVLDLGCGPADISIRFARAYPDCFIHGVEGARAMLCEGETALNRSGLQHRIELVQGVIPHIEPPLKKYQVLLCNSLLHHLHDPSVLWKYIMKYSTGDTQIFVMDLMRPWTCQDAEKLVNTYCGSEPENLRRDFYNSLCAAFRPKEVEMQLADAGLQGLRINVISDRHLIVYGKIIDAQK